MLGNFKRSLGEVLQSEGGYVNHKKDPGGHTNKGVTLRTFRFWYGPDRTVQDLKNITTQQVTRIYREGYWEKVRADELPLGLDLLLFDMAVNAGPGRAIKLLQAALGVTQDGVLGPITLGAIRKVKPEKLLKDLARNASDESSAALIGAISP